MGKNAPVRYKTIQNAFGRWVLVNARHVGYAWSGARWVYHDRGLPSMHGGYQICNFSTEQEAADYALDSRCMFKRLPLWARIRILLFGPVLAQSRQ